jgi:hypothetical protein
VIELRVAKKMMVCNRIYCGRIIEKGEMYYWNRLMKRSYCKAHQPPSSDVRRQDART